MRSKTAKSGVEPSACVELAKHVSLNCPNLQFCGLMTIEMPDYTSTPENFKTLANCRSEFFMTKPYACDPSSLPKYPPCKEMDAKLRDEEARRLRAGGRANADEVKKARAWDRAERPIPAPDAKC
ncbi:hypothetical protein F3Y22_tig00111954pilonHSYRG00080 [Hibiscus syriacus]|uniref:Uncharacterized protein n=1 Tax=Hibiscus syriacus TaxID=106335 RepID=A0A6A2X7T6_HIBSY|nr:hypothetical protein F3Y22_tig00111954pilonHSYRG00080 [Hibiscus syriacus]